MWEALTGQEPSRPAIPVKQHFAQIMGLKLRSEALDPGTHVPPDLRNIIVESTDPEPETRQHDLGHCTHDQAPTGPSCGWSGAVPIGYTATSNTTHGNGFTSLVSAGCAAFVAVVSLFGIGVLVWSNGVFSGPAERPVVQLVPTLEDANLALQRKNNQSTPTRRQPNEASRPQYEFNVRSCTRVVGARASRTPVSLRCEGTRPYQPTRRVRLQTRSGAAAPPAPPSSWLKSMDRSLQNLNTPAQQIVQRRRPSTHPPHRLNPPPRAAPPPKPKSAVRKRSTTGAAAPERPYGTP